MILFTVTLPPLSQGGRVASDIVAWLKKKTGPPARTLTTAEEAKAFKESGDVVVVGFFADAESAAAKAYVGAADGIDDTLFAITSVPEVATALEASMESIVLFKSVRECEGEGVRG